MQNLDTPEHEIMGRILPDLLDMLPIRWFLAKKEGLPAIIEEAAQCVCVQKSSAAIVLPQGCLC